MAGYRTIKGSHTIFAGALLTTYVWFNVSFAETNIVVQPSAEPKSSTNVVIQPKTESPAATTPQPQVQTPANSSTTPTVVVVPVVTEPSTEKKTDVEKLVRKASDYTKQNGREAAFGEFNKKEGQFTAGTSYIFAMDYSGKLLADGYNSEMIGKNQFDLKDLDGKYINRDLITKAKAGGGWETYRWPNPVTNVMECKKTFVLPMEGYFIASGYYYLPNSEGSCD